MVTYVALLRGINVGGHKKIKMADLREHLESWGFNDVTSYIQSGNIAFQSSLTARECEKIISDGIRKEYGWEVPVLVRTASQIIAILENCPFPKEKKEKSYFSLLSDAPHEDDIQEANSLTPPPNEEFVVTAECIYFFCATYYGKAKLSNNWFEKKLKVSATSRNYRTMMKLVEMAS